MPEDVFVNQAYLSVIESAANTLTFSKLETGISIYEKVGWLLSRLDYQFDALVANFGAEADNLQFGISVSDQIATATFGNTAVVDWNMLIRADMGAAASGMFEEWPKSKSFADLPGGGLLIPPNPIYIFVKGSALGSAVTVQARMFYTVKKLKTEDFWELVEQRRMIGA